MPVGLSPSSESSAQDEVLGAGCGLAEFEAEQEEQSQTSALYVGKAALPTREWLCGDGVWGGDQPLAKDSGFPPLGGGGALSCRRLFWPRVSHSGHTGKTRGAPCPSWLIGTLLLQSQTARMYQNLRLH